MHKFCLLFLRIVLFDFGTLLIVCIFCFFTLYWPNRLTCVCTGILHDSKGVIKGRKSKKDRQCNVQNKKVKRINNDLQNFTQKTKNRSTRTPLKPGVTSGALGGKQLLLHMWHPSCNHVITSQSQSICSFLFTASDYSKTFLKSTINYSNLMSSYKNYFTVSVKNIEKLKI